MLLRYLEEMLAETYAQLRTKGINLDAVVEGIKFPLAGYDITIAKAGTEILGNLLGPINVGSMVWNVWISRDKR